jgi:hypothetical protein
MSLKIIAFLMTGILAFLFIWAYFYAPKARKRSELEALFYQEVLRLKKAGITEPSDLLKELAQKYGAATGRNPEQLMTQIK